MAYAAIRVARAEYELSGWIAFSKCPEARSKALNASLRLASRRLHLCEGLGVYQQQWRNSSVDISSWCLRFHSLWERPQMAKPRERSVVSNCSRYTSQMACAFPVRAGFVRYGPEETAKRRVGVIPESSVLHCTRSVWIEETGLGTVPEDQSVPG